MFASAVNITCFAVHYSSIHHPLVGHGYRIDTCDCTSRGLEAG